jgi:uncharacterized protein (DUF1499 family)
VKRFLPLIAYAAFAGFALAFATGIVACLGVRLGLFHYTVGVDILYWCVGAGLFGLAAGIAWAAITVIANISGAPRYGALGLVGSAFVIFFPLQAAWQYHVSPPIHDISTDIEYPPRFKALLTERKGAENPPEFEGRQRITFEGKRYSSAAAQRKFYTDVHPIRLLTKPAPMFQRAVSAANAMGWNIVSQDPDTGRIEATDTTFFFGFTDDIAIRIRPAGTLGSTIDVRSKSRVGKSDLGRNADRIRDYVKALSRT